MKQYIFYLLLLCQVLWVAVISWCHMKQVWQRVFPFRGRLTWEIGRSWFATFFLTINQTSNGQGLLIEVKILTRWFVSLDQENYYFPCGLSLSNPAHHPRIPANRLIRTPPCLVLIKWRLGLWVECSAPFELPSKHNFTSDIKHLRDTSMWG